MGCVMFINLVSLKIALAKLGFTGSIRLRNVGGNAVGSVRTLIPPPNIEYSNIQWVRQTGTVGAGGAITWDGAITPIIGETNNTYTLTAADFPVPGSTQAIRVFAMVNGPSVTSEYAIHKP